MAKHTAFFYGTLMHPKILRRVIQNDGPHPEVCPAVLLDYTRHSVQWCDYPGIIPASKSVKILQRSLTLDEKSVRGTLVKGLTAEDMSHLDNFETDQYKREKVQVYPLGPFRDGSTESVEETLIPVHPTPLPDFGSLSEQNVEAETYIFCDEHDLDPQLWSFEDFVKNNARKWF